MKEVNGGNEGGSEVRMRNEGKNVRQGMGLVGVLVVSLIHC